MQQTCGCYLYGIKDFATVITYFRMGRLSWIIWVGPCDYIGRQEGHSQRWRCDNRAEMRGRKERFEDFMLQAPKIVEGFPS